MWLRTLAGRVSASRMMKRFCFLYMYWLACYYVLTTPALWLHCCHLICCAVPRTPPQCPATPGRCTSSTRHQALHGPRTTGRSGQQTTLGSRCMMTPLAAVKAAMAVRLSSFAAERFAWSQDNWAQQPPDKPWQPLYDDPTSTS